MLHVFCCYAHRDQIYLKRLKAHLSALEREGLIAFKADIDIPPGTLWEKEIDHHLERADLFLLLVSADFIASDYCYEKEMKLAIERHKQGTALVIPIILHPCEWKETPLGALQALPKDGKPVLTWTNPDSAFLNIARGLRRVLQEFPGSRAFTPPIAGMLLCTIRPTASLPGIGAVTWLPDGDHLATLASNGAIQIWHTSKGQQVTHLSLPSHPLGLAARSPDCYRVATVPSYEPQTVHLWDGRSGQLLTTHALLKGGVGGLAWSPDASLLATCYRTFATAQTIIWRVDREQTACRFATGSPIIEWSPDNVHLTVAHLSSSWHQAGEGRIEIWNAETGIMVKKDRTRHKNVWKTLLNVLQHEDVFPISLAAAVESATAFAWSPDGRSLVLGGLSSRQERERGADLRFTYHTAYRRWLSRWDTTVDTNRILSEEPEERSNERRPKTWKVLCWSPDATRIAVSGSEGDLYIHDADTGYLLLTCQAGGPARALLWSPDSTRIAVQFEDSVRIWQVQVPSARRSADTAASAGYRKLFAPPSPSPVQNAGPPPHRSVGQEPASSESDQPWQAMLHNSGRATSQEFQPTAQPTTANATPPYSMCLSRWRRPSSSRVGCAGVSAGRPSDRQRRSNRIPTRSA